MTQHEHFVLTQTCSKSAELKITYKSGEKQWKIQNFQFNLNIFRINFYHIHHRSNVRISMKHSKERQISQWIIGGVTSVFMNRFRPHSKQTRIKELLLSNTECKMHVPDIILRARNFNLGHVDYIISVGNNAGDIECFFIQK